MVARIHTSAHHRGDTSIVNSSTTPTPQMIDAAHQVMINGPWALPFVGHDEIASDSVDGENYSTADAEMRNREAIGTVLSAALGAEGSPADGADELAAIRDGIARALETTAPDSESTVSLLRRLLVRDAEIMQTAHDAGRQAVEREHAKNGMIAERDVTIADLNTRVELLNAERGALLSSMIKAHMILGQLVMVGGCSMEFAGEVEQELRDLIAQVRETGSISEPIATRAGEMHSVPGLPPHPVGSWACCGSIVDPTQAAAESDDDEGDDKLSDEQIEQAAIGVLLGILDADDLCERPNCTGCPRVRAKAEEMKSELTDTGRSEADLMPKLLGGILGTPSKVVIGSSAELGGMIAGMLSQLGARTRARQ